MTAATQPAARAVAKTKTAHAASLHARKLAKLGLHEPIDFVLHLPLRYEDRTRVTAIESLRPGAWAQVEGTISRCEISTRPRRQLTATISDDTGVLNLRWLHFYPSQQKQLTDAQHSNPHDPQRLRVWGEVRGGLFGVEMVHPRVTRADTPLPTTLTPVYPSTDGLPQPVLRRAIAAALAEADLQDTLPEAILTRYALPAFDWAIRTLHAPPPDVSETALAEHAHPAWQRIKFDELLAQQLSLAAARAARQRQRARPLPRVRAADLIARLHAALPFTLTAAQTRVAAEISADLERAHPMHRLLQGDVGSGKTVVAALAALQAIGNGQQVALMAPTELLAEQHARKLTQWLAPLGMTIAWLTGSLNASARRAALTHISEGTAQLIIGTQALIQDGVDYAALGLVIVDEQHRFGVGQRLALHRKGEAADNTDNTLPHQLTMSATPIPRTLAMTFFADLDVSTLDELPPGRTPVVTKLITDARRDQVIARVAHAARAGRQAYWVCPLVEESEALALQTAVDTHQSLCELLPDLRLGLLHGRLSSAEKTAVMSSFHAGELDVLVATTVIEVGVDVPNATLMVIEHAERFGLAQLHQLRGRVGRGQGVSVCVLLYQPPLSREARARLRALYDTTDGFEIARRDLEQRGPGEFLGLRQSGEALLRFADLQADALLAKRARSTAATLQREHPTAARAHLARWLRGREAYLRS